MIRYNCNQFDVLASALKLENTNINEVAREVYPNGLSRIVVNVEPTSEVVNCCPHCGKICSPYDTPRRNEPPKTWRSLDFGNEIVLLQHKPHRVVCPDHGVVTAYVPWAYPNSCFTREFEQQTVWMAMHMNKSAVAEYMRITWPTVGRCISRVRNDVEPDSSSRLNGLVKIGIDENAYGKGHNKFVMIVVNHCNNEVVWVKEGRSKDVISCFFEELSEEQRSTIELVSADGAEWIHDVVRMYCPNAHICIDTFHVFEWITSAQNEVRLEEYKNKIMEVKEIREERRDLRDDNDLSNEERDRAVHQLAEIFEKLEEDTQLIKSSTYLFTANPLNLTPEEELKYQRLIAICPKLQRVSARVGLFRNIMHNSDHEAAEKELNNWIGWAFRSRLAPFKKLAKTIKKYKELIMNTIKYGLNNARVEANNNVIKAIIRRSYGFRNIRNLIDLILLTCSQRYVVLPNRGQGEKGQPRWRVYRTQSFVPATA